MHTRRELQAIHVAEGGEEVRGGVDVLDDARLVVLELVHHPMASWRVRAPGWDQACLFKFKKEYIKN